MFPATRNTLSKYLLCHSSHCIGSVRTKLDVVAFSLSNLLPLLLLEKAYPRVFCDFTYFWMISEETAPALETK